MRENFKYIFLDKSIKYSVLLSIILTVAQALALIGVYQFFPPVIPLFNSLPWGEDRLAPREYIFLVPLFIMAMLIVNIYLAILANKRILLSRMVSLNVLLSALLSVVALIQILILAL